MGCMKVIVRHFVGLLAFFTWLSGTIIIALCLWTIATASNFNQLIDGKLVVGQSRGGRSVTTVQLAHYACHFSRTITNSTTTTTSYDEFFTQTKQPVTYFTLGFGGLLFLNGLLGWTGASKKNSILLKLFIVLSFLIVLAEIGAIITICIFKSNSNQLIDQTWQELNKKSHNLLQEQLICCGLNGPNDYDNSRDIDQSCFYREPELPRNVGDNGLVISEDPPSQPISSVSGGPFAKDRKINQIGCKTKLSEWLFDQRLLILAFIGSLLMYQIITMLLTSAAISLMRRGKRRHDSLEELDSGSSNHHLHHHGATYM